MRYTVTATIQSANIDGNEPVEVQWYGGPDLAQAISAMVQAAAHNVNDEGSTMPESVRYKTLKVVLNMDEAQPSVIELREPMYESSPEGL